MKLTDQQKNLLALYKRSTKDADGWANASQITWPLIKELASPSPDLFELEMPVGAQHHGRVRLTDTGAILLEYVV